MQLQAKLKAEGCTIQPLGHATKHRKIDNQALVT